jgi:hypothetical protein
MQVLGAFQDGRKVVLPTLCAWGCRVETGFSSGGTALTRRITLRDGRGNSNSVNGCELSTVCYGAGNLR